jgi:lysyl-tRNA synthetase class 2
MLQKRAALFAHIRHFFSARKVLEVDVPAITAQAVTDPHIDSLCVSFSGRADFAGHLITSPELYMKRLLAAGSGDIYSLSHVFRVDESGSRHHREFTMLEWYRIGWNLDALMQEVRDLVCGLIGRTEKMVRYTTYRQAFLDHAGVDPFRATLTELKQCAQEKLSPAFDTDERAIWLDLLFSHLVEPQLQGLVFVMEFPVAQAALAQTKTDECGNAVAARFELYIDGVEIANGYQEELCAEVLRQRFQQDQAVRAQREQIVPEMDECFLAAMAAGLPACAGVALGVDRLLMVASGEKTIRAVVPFME